MIGGKGAAANMSFAVNTKKKEEAVVMVMTETETIETFSMTSFIVSTDSQILIQNLDERSERYEANVKSHENPDGFAGASTQTLNNTQKHQNEAAIPTPLQDNGCQALSFEINEATSLANKEDVASIGVGTEDITEDPAGLSVGVRQFVTDAVNMALVSPGCILDVDDLTRPSSEKEGGKTKRKKQDTGTSAATGAGASFVGGSSVAVGNSTTGASGANVGASTSGVNAGTDVAVDAASATQMVNDVIAAEVDSSVVLFQKQAAAVLASDNLLKRLEMVERAAQQNAFHRKQLDYRDLPDVKPLVLTSEKSRNKQEEKGNGMGLPFGMSQAAASPVEEEPVAFEASTTLDEDGYLLPTKKLFTYFNSDLVQGRSVTTMVWNKVNQDLLAVGYGKLDTFVDNNKAGEYVDEQLQGGLVLFWSLRNPEYPEKVLRTPSPVTAMEFSRLSPMLLAVGFASGDVNVYDVKREGAEWSTPVESSVGMAVGQGHTDSVWQVKWVPRGAERVENLVSISTDGRVLQWSIKKGLGVSCLMRLARSGQTDGWISRQASGICFDFCSDDPTTYIVGTEEGTLHKCSVSYSEQYLETYIPHAGPVYTVKCSPRWPQVFLTCSADWTIGLYHMHVKDRPIFQMRASGEDFAITDVCWCPDNSTVFAAVTQNGMLQIWDLSVSCLDPVVNYDTTKDDVTQKVATDGTKAVEGDEFNDDDPLNLGSRTAPGTTAQSMPPGAPGLSRLGATEQKDESKESRIQRLVRNLGNENDNQRRVLTSVAFCERAPALVVGDSHGALTVYRIIDPVVITHMGPVQQTEKIKAAVAALDPSVAELLNNLNKEKNEEK
jgi:WD40 repeat protein